MLDTVTVKVGTSTLTGGRDTLDREFLPQLADQLCDLADAGTRVLLVTSGAVRAGAEQLGWPARPRAVSLRQAAAAVGQGRLMAAYAEAFSRRGRAVGQVLLTRQLAEDRTCYVNAQSTLNTLLRHGVVPIVNENDTVAVEELQFGDNDTLAALVAALVGADLLLLLTDVPGLLDCQGRVIPRIEALTPELRALGGGSGRHGSGGMATKLLAADIAAAAGVATVVAHGREPGIVLRVARGEPAGTYFAPSRRRLRGRKHWLAYGLRPRGRLVVNERARHALVRENRSLLPAGVVAVHGPFAPGEAVSLCGEDGAEFARGMVSCDWRDAERLMGAHTSRARELLGPGRGDELVHRDNLVILDEAGGAA